MQIDNLTQNYPDFELVDSSATTIEGIPAHKIESTATDDKEQKRKGMQFGL